MYIQKKFNDIIEQEGPYDEPNVKISFGFEEF